MGVKLPIVGGPNLVRAIVILAGLSIATCATAQTSVFDQRRQVFSFEIVNQTEPIRPATTPTAPPSSGPATTSSSSPSAPASSPETKNKVAKEITDKVQEFLAKREFAKAIAVITEALATDTANAELYRLRATIQCRAANVKLCLEDVSKAVETDTDYAPAYLFRGLVRIDIGQPQDALPDCEATIRIWPERPLGYNCRGLANSALREFARATTDFDEALSRDAKFAAAHYNKGLNFARQNKLDEAIESFSAAVQINDKYDESYAQRGNARVAKGDVAGGRADFAKALSLNGRNFTAAVGMQALQVGKALDTLAGKK